MCVYIYVLVSVFSIPACYVRHISNVATHTTVFSTQVFFIQKITTIKKVLSMSEFTGGGRFPLSRTQGGLFPLQLLHSTMRLKPTLLILMERVPGDCPHLSHHRVLVLTSGSEIRESFLFSSTPPLLRAALPTMPQVLVHKTK